MVVHSNRAGILDNRDVPFFRLSVAGLWSGESVTAVPGCVASATQTRPDTELESVESCSYATDFAAIFSPILVAAAFWKSRLVRSTKAKLSARQLSSKTPSP